jgi:hypothetical protein
MRSKMIRKVAGGWKVLSEKGKNLGGPYASRKKAKERLAQVEKFKHMNKSVSYVIIEKARAYTRTKKGKIEQVKQYGMVGVPTENKKPDHITDRKSSPGDGLKSLESYKTVWELGQAINKELNKIPQPPGFGGFAVGFEQNSKSMVISFDEPRELRHPEDYKMPEYETSNARDRYRKLSDAVDKVISKLEDMKVRAVVAFDSSDIKNWITGKPKESEYVK